MINWFNKLTSGLKTTSDKLSGGISDIFTKRRIDASSLDDLEEILLEADLGYQATSEIIKNFSARKLERDASAEDIKQAGCAASAGGLNLPLLPRSVVERSGCPAESELSELGYLLLHCLLSQCLQSGASGSLDGPDGAACEAQQLL